MTTDEEHIRNRYTSDVQHILNYILDCKAVLKYAYLDIDGLLQEGLDTNANDIMSNKPYTAVAKTLRQIKSLQEIDADEIFLELCEGYIGNDMYNHDGEESNES